jgi:hypothetical protein
VRNFAEHKWGISMSAIKVEGETMARLGEVESIRPKPPI